MIIETCAKVNLCLELLRRREDGFHELATVFCAIDLCDRIELTAAPSLTVAVTGADIPADERNLCHRAAVLLAERCGREPAVRLTIHKHIPVGAGLGGGSGNAAGVLAALAALWSVAIPGPELVELAAALGSDVPFFLHGGTALAGGRGESLAPLPVPRGLALVVVSPAEAVPTGEVYGAVTSFRHDAGRIAENLAAALRSGRVPPSEEWLINDLEAPACRVGRKLADDRALLERLVPGAYRLSGSGGAWFLPVSEGDGPALRQRLVEAFDGREVWLTRPVGYGWRKLTD